MPVVYAIFTAARVISAVYKILATAVMGYYLTRSVIEHHAKMKRNNVPYTPYRECPAG